MTPNQPQFLRGTTTPPERLGATSNQAYEPDHDEHTFTQAPSGSGLPPPSPHLQNESVLSSGSSRPSHYNVLESGGATMRSRKEGSRASKVKSFERPHIGALDHVSAISLDDFWKQV